ncbi:MAG: type II toxin-antitoxin system antitoxin SocA domain-containing protein [Sphingobacteriales bacterium]
MKSPVTGKEMKLIKELISLSYRKENFEVLYHVYECEDSGERFTDNAFDEINTVQVYNQYREKYGIPFPEQIKAIREKYSVSALKMSEILGLGTNSYRLYESGEMPTVANGRLILSVSDPAEFLKQIRASSHILSEKERKKFTDVCLALIKQEKENWWERTFEDHIFQNQSPNQYSGYRQPDLARIGQVIAFFDGKLDLFKTKLNKLLFYSDFCAYKQTGFSITGITYRAIPYGPVPSEYEKLYIKLCDDNAIDIQNIQIHRTGDFADLIKPKWTFDPDRFSAIEVEVLEKVAKAFKSKSTKEVVDISHREAAWSENEPGRNNINYQQFAFLITYL